jgi:two-component system phosphate regulon sensor histidine kinase PhoR
MDIEENLLPDPRSVSGIVDAVGRMRVLIEELLDVDKIEREARTRTGLIRPAALIQEVIEEFQVQFEQKQLTFSKELDANLLPLHGNRLQIRQAMVNLLSNAVKYTLPGDAITLRAFVEGDKFRFSVQDTGIGIPKALQAKIFQHGYRAQRDDINAIEGSGVGLSLVAEICRRHHGDVWFVSEEGVGSTFGFWLPIDGGTGREPAS